MTTYNKERWNDASNGGDGSDVGGRFKRGKDRGDQFEEGANPRGFAPKSAVRKEDNTRSDHSERAPWDQHDGSRGKYSGDQWRERGEQNLLRKGEDLQFSGGTRDLWNDVNRNSDVHLEGMDTGSWQEVSKAGASAPGAIKYGVNLDQKSGKKYGNK
jgi:hypothetical protein